MQIQYFTIPVLNASSAQEELNSFLRQHKVLEVQQEFFQGANEAYWCVSVSYISGPPVNSRSHSRKKVDYKNVLDAKRFEMFSRMRTIRKEMAKADAVPAYVIFTDAELAQIVQLKEMNLNQLRNIPGIGKGKTERYGAELLRRFNETKENETPGESD